MYFRPERRFKILDIADDFAHLKRVRRDGTLDFEFFYRVSPNDVVTNDASVVRIEIFSRSIGFRPLLENTTLGNIDTRQLVRNIMTRSVDAKSVIKQRKQYVVATKKSDVTSKINNEIIGQLRANVPAKDIWQNYQTKLDYVPAASIKTSADVRPILDHVAHNFVAPAGSYDYTSFRDRPSRLMHDMIVRQGVDPTYIFDLTPRSIPAIDSFSGMLRPSCTYEVQNSPATRLLNYYVFPHSPCYPRYSYDNYNSNSIPDGNLIAVLVRTPKTQIELSTILTVPNYSFNYDGGNNTHFFAKFELIDNTTGQSIDTIIKSFDISQHLKLFNTPKKPPIVKVSKSDFSARANIEIKQIDPGAKAVKIYKKNTEPNVIKTRL